ncbi:MAG: hypothetical protein WKI04_18060 [Ferruginibacter sp.]
MAIKNKEFILPDEKIHGQTIPELDINETGAWQLYNFFYHELRGNSVFGFLFLIPKIPGFNSIFKLRDSPGQPKLLFYRLHPEMQ